MSYLFIVLIGGVVGWSAGQYFGGREYGGGVDVALGAAGAVVLVLIARTVSPASGSGAFFSALVAIVGAFVSLFVMRRAMKARKPAPMANWRRR